MKPVVGGVNKTQFLAICIHKATIDMLRMLEDGSF